MGPAQKKYMAMLQADAKKKAASETKPAPKKPEEPKGLRGLISGRRKKIDEASGYAEGGKAKGKKRC